MQNYGQQAQGYQRPGSTTSFAAPAGPPPPYGTPHGYQSAAPQAQSQWAPPAQNQPSNQQWNQSQQAAGGYTQGQQVTSQPSNTYSQQQDVPPPPPPKPAGFTAAVQQQQQTSQSWGQQPSYGTQQPQQSYQSQQQNTGFAAQGQHGGYNQQGGFQAQGIPQQSYNNAAPPPPSQTPGGSYFPPAQQGRPGSIYGADQVGTYSTPPSATAQQPPPNVLSPNEQQPAYVPPSLTGQGVQSYMPANTNPMPGVYIPPPPDIPAWQQAQHAPLQGGKKFKYTKPTVDPSFYAQGYSGVQPVQQQEQGQYGQQPQHSLQQFGQQAQNQFQSQSPIQQQGQFGQPVQNQFPQAQAQQQSHYGQTMQPQQHQYGQPVQQFNQHPQQAPPQYAQTPQGQQNPQQFQQPPNQWQPTPPITHGFDQQQQGTQDSYAAQPNQQAWQPGHQSQGSGGQQYPQGEEQGIQAPRPINGHTGTTPPGFVNQPSPQSQPVSPVQNRQSVSFSSGQNQAGLGRTGSVSSIALGAIHAQRAGNRTESPKPPPPKLPTPPPPRDHASKFSALGMGGPSDWEHFGMGSEEVDDEELFGAKKDDTKAEPAQLDSVELPAQHPSPPSTLGHPSPQHQPAPLNIQRRDTFQPTPPPKSSGNLTQRPPSQPPQQSFATGAAAPQQPQQSFVMGDAVAMASYAAQSPQPIHQTQPPPAQQTFVMGDGGWAPPKQATPTQQQPQAQAPPPLPQQQQPPPATQQEFVMDDGGWSAQSTAPHNTQMQVRAQEPPATSDTFVMGDASWGAPRQAPSHVNGGTDIQLNQTHVAELKAKDEAYERLMVDHEKEIKDLHEEIEQLKVVIEATKSYAETERNVLNEQIQSMKTSTEQAQNDVEASIKEKESALKERETTIERLKEDMEGKDDTIKEKDDVIADLKTQLKNKDGAIADLTQELKTEKAREPPKPTPADLISDIDPWYAGSLERYIAMLRGEAHEPLVEDKIKVFTAFLKDESSVRGLNYDTAPPPAQPAQEAIQQHVESNVGLSRGASNASVKNQDLNVQVPQQSSPPEDFQYSPGGRPIIQRQPTFPSTETVPTQQSFGEPSGQSTTVLTPTSSQDEDFNKTPTPVQSPPEEQTQSQYKAYVPPSVTQSDSAKSLHRQSVSFSPSVAPSQTPGSGKNNDEIFFGGHAPPPSVKSSSRPTTAASDVPVPAPLFAAQPTVAAAPAPKPAPVSTTKKDPVGILNDMIPTQIASAQPNPQLEAVRKKATEVSSDFSFIQEVTVTWEKAAALARRLNDDARRKRQEESEAHTDQLFNDHEISYADIGDIEDEFKEKERELKALEDRDEYKSYIENVFDDVYNRLQTQIKTLMDLYLEAESLAHTSVSGIKSLEGGDAATVEASLQLLKELHDQIETRHGKVVVAVSERDKRYKKTEIQPLYAAGNISKMKNVEKHFESAERQAMLRAKSEKAERVGELVKVAEEAVVGAVGIEQGEIDRILAAIRDLPEKSDPDLTIRARETLLALKSSSKSLLSLFNALEIDLNTSVFEAELAQTRVENTGPAKIKELENEMAEGEKKLKDEFQRRVGVIDQDKEEIDKLIEEKGGSVTSSEEDEKKLRMSKALEAAKRRNGDL